MSSDQRTGTAAALAELGAREPIEQGGEAGADEVQEDLFADSAALPTLLVPKTDGSYGHDTLERRGPGRPKGSRNLKTRQLVELVTQKYGHPVLRMAELAATPIPILAKTLGMSMADAAEYHRKLQNDLAPYVAQKLPQMHQIDNSTVGMLMINLGGQAGGMNTSEFGIPLQLSGDQGEAIEAKENIEENQEVEEADAAQSETGSRTDGASD